MNILHKMVQFSQIDEILEQCVGECSKEELVDCIKLIAINLAYYRKHHGDQPIQNMGKLLTAEQIDDETAMVLAEGMLQCAISLAQIQGRNDLLKRLQSMDDSFEVDWKQIDLERQSANTPVRFHTERFFYNSSINGSGNGWYFTVRGGRVYGPFSSEDSAKAALKEMLDRYAQHGDTGGR